MQWSKPEMKLKPFIAMVVLFGLLPGALGAAPLSWQTSLAAPAGTIRYAKPAGLTSGDCGSWPNACELQYALSVAGAGDEIWVKKGVYVPTDGIPYGSCQEIRDAVPDAADGDYVIQHQGDAFLVYCFDMAGAPAEYLTLADPASNFAQYTAGGYSQGDDVRTEYEKVRLLPETLQIDIRDQSYAIPNGKSLTQGETAVVTSVYYGVAIDCVKQHSQTGVARIDLRGTPFMVADTFVTCGYLPGGSSVFSEGDQVVELTGGGECGSMQPASTSDCLLSPFNDTGGPQPILELGYLGPERRATFQLVSGVAIYGGFAGTETSRDDRDWEAHVTALSGDLLGNDGPNFTNYAENSYRVVTGSGADASAVLDGFTVSGGNADGVDLYSRGGGMFNDGGSPTLTNVTFSGNYGRGGGGGMYNYHYSTPTLTNVTFSGNTAGWYGGGGMFNFDSSPTLTNVTFTGNTGVHGGGMCNVTSSPTLTNVTFTGNNEGGGMDNSFYSSPTLHNCILWGNSAPDGPEIYNDLSTPTISYSLVEGSGGSDNWDANLGSDGGYNIDADPLFVDAASGDLHLRPKSPAVDAGNNDYVTVTTDLDGNPRIGNGRVDMGAYEYVLRVYLPLVTRSSP
jgi:hypothetical protein